MTTVAADRSVAAPPTRCPKLALLDEENAPPWALDAIADGGGDLAPLEEAEALLLWHHPPDPADVLDALGRAPGVRWIQLPSAGVDRYADVLARVGEEVTLTCAKGIYAEPVAEHALALALAGLRDLTARARTNEWGGETSLTLYDKNVTCLGGGGITEAFVRLLAPFRTRTTVVRRNPAQMEGVAQVVPPTGLHDALASADVVLVALALTDETDGMLGADEFRVMKDHAWLVNIARGRIVDQDALIVALQEGWIGGAALDAMTPEPLPSDHVLWTLDNCLITPHVAVGYELGLPLLGERFRQNVGHFANGTEMVGLVDLLRGY